MPNNQTQKELRDEFDDRYANVDPDELCREIEREVMAGTFNPKLWPVTRPAGASKDPPIPETD